MAKKNRLTGVAAARQGIRDHRKGMSQQLEIVKEGKKGLKKAGKYVAKKTHQAVAGLKQLKTDLKDRVVMGRKARADRKKKKK